MAHPLDGVRVKIKRAKRHLEELRAEVDDLLARYQTAIVHEVELDGLNHVYRLKGAPRVPPHLSAIVGDVAHNLRSALDHLAWQVLLHRGKTPTKYTSFPIVRDPLDKGGKPRWPNFAVEPPRHPDRFPLPADDPFVTALREVQPFSNDADHPGRHQLWVIHELNKIDKHRDLILGAVRLQGFSRGVPHDDVVEAVYTGSTRMSGESGF